LVALLLDLVIRRDTRGRRSLDDVMRALWRRYGRHFYSANGGVGVEDHELEALFDEVTGLALKSVFDLAVRGTRDLPLVDAFASMGMTLTNQIKVNKLSLNVRVQQEGGMCKLASVHETGAAHQAGLSAGDTLVAVDGLRVSGSNLDGLLQRYRAGDVVEVHAFRRDELMTFDVTLESDTAPQFALTMRDKPLTALRIRKAWLKSRS
jgi:predicted metalloprotease with PDZ domain